jgi:hypothetical protein
MAATLIPDTVLPLYSRDVWSAVFPASPPDARACVVLVVGPMVKRPRPLTGMSRTTPIGLL